MHGRVRGLVIASVVVVGVTLAGSTCSKTAVTPSTVVVQPLRATGQTNTQPPVFIDVTLRPGTTTAGQQQISGTYTATPVEGTSFSGSVSGTVAGTFDNGGNGGNFTGTVTADLPGCTASRPYQGPLTRTTLTWVGQPPTNTCNGTSPLTFDVTLPVTVDPSEPASPSVAVSTTLASVTSASQTGTVQVTANTSWTAASNQSWLTISSGASGGSGTTTLTYAVQANTGPARSGTITVAHGSTSATFTVNQIAGATPTPTLNIAPAAASPSASGGPASATVTAANLSGSWTANAVSTGDWLSITSGSSGGNGTTTLNYSVSANLGGVRTGTITVSANGVSSQVLTVTQQAATPSPALQITALNPNPPTLGSSTGTGSATVTAANLAGTWTATATSTGNWLSITSGSTGGNGTTTLNYSVLANSGGQRTGTITVSANGVSSQTLTITQQAFVPTPTLSIAPLNPNPPTLGSSTGVGSATVTAANLGGTWTATATSTGNWLSITSGSTGGNGTTTLTYSAQTNSSSTQRTGTITVSANGVSSQVLTVTQQGFASLTIAPQTASITASAQTGSATVTATNVGAWTAFSNQSWLTITSGASGGNGATTLIYSAQANSGALRSGTITVQSLVPSATLTVTQAAGGPATISWVYDLSVRGMVIGTPPGETDRRTVTVPSGTLLSIDLSFSSATPNGCPNPALQGGFYAIGSGTNIASISLLGYRYPATGGIEVGNQGPCGSNGVFSGLRLFVSGSGVPIAPGGTLVHWPPASSFGNMFINGPAAPAPGLLPILLPSNPFPIGTGGTITPFATNVQLVIESGQISTKPEPLADVWLGGAVFGALVTRRLARRRKAH